MNFPKTKTKYIKGLGFTKIRPYLTTAEIDGIINSIQEQTTDYATRNIIMYTMVISLCTEIKDFQSEDVDIQLAEMYYTNGIFEDITKHIKGFDILKNGIDQLATKDIYARFESALEGFTNQFKDINIDDTMNKFEAELGKLKEVEKQKEEILNGK